MKTNLYNRFAKGAAVAALLVASFASAKEIQQTNLGKVFDTGTGSASSAILSTKTVVQPGVYAIGDDNEKLFGSKYLVVDNFVNDEGKTLAILIDRKATDSKSGRATGRFYQGRPIKGGASVMFSPIYIDVYGNLVVESELSEQAQVIEVTARTGNESLRYPYMLQGHNGALNGKLLGMRAAVTQQPNFKVQPTNNVFEGACESNKVVISGTTAALHRPGFIEERLEMIPMNGDLGKFAQLVTSEFNTMGEYMVSDSQVSKLAFFMTASNHQELFVVASPQATVGSYTLEFYGPQNRSFLDFFAPGRTVPGERAKPFWRR